MTPSRSHGWRRNRAVVALLTTAVALIAFPGASSGDVTAVKGSATGYFASLAILGNPPIARGPTAVVTLPPAGSSPIQTAAPGETVMYGPATNLSYGSVELSTQGALGPAGSVASSAALQSIGVSGQEVFTATSASSSYTASESG